MKKWNTMESNKGIAILLLYFLAQFQESLSTECVELENSIIRTFPSLLSFQANKIPFDPKNSSEGNYVAFSFKSLDHLNSNAFITFDSEHIIKIDLDGKSLNEIEDGSFTSLTCLKYLTLNNNSISELNWNTFEGLPNLQTLELSGNKLKELPAMVFRSERLVKLDLSNNELKKLSPFIFAKLANLKSLDLKGNKLMYVKAEVFLPLATLENLDLSGNKLVELDADKWPLPTLKHLNVSKNFIRSFDTSLNYTFRSLKSLNLSSNYLTQLNSLALTRTFHSLSVLDLNDNYWTCEDLSNILHYLADVRLEIPSRNKTESNEKGIDCENERKKMPLDVETSSQIYHSSTESNPDPVHGKLNAEMNNLSNKSDEILLEISGIRKLLIFSLFFIMLCVIVYAILQVGLCDGMSRRFRPRDGYTQPSQDNYATLMS